MGPIFTKLGNFHSKDINSSWLAFKLQKFKDPASSDLFIVLASIIFSCINKIEVHLSFA